MKKTEKLKQTVITRFAPSPTGELHLGGARTALFNFLFACHFQGKFLLRIDNTDVNRNVKSSVKDIVNYLDYLGIDFANKDSLYYQLNHLDFYHQIVQQLIKTHHAYYCFCSPADLEKSYLEQKQQKKVSFRYDQRCLKLSSVAISKKLASHQPVSVRFKIAEDKVYTWTDLVRGVINVKSCGLEDFIILRNNKIPTFHLATVCDDYQLKISHVLRGEEHLYNTAKHLAIAEALNWPAPIFGHFSIIVNSEGKKMSKRSGDPLFFIKYFVANQFNKDAVINYLALLGWSPDKLEEVFSLKQLIQRFDGTKLVSAACHFNEEKMLWFNHQHLLKLAPETLYHLCLPLLEVHYQDFQIDRQSLIKLVNFLLPKMNVVSEIVQLSKEVLTVQYLNEELVQLDPERTAALQSLSTCFSALSLWNQVELKHHLNLFCQANAFTKKFVFLLLRKIVSNQEHGVSLFFLLEFWGKSKLLRLINHYLNEK